MLSARQISISPLIDGSIFREKHSPLDQRPLGDSLAASRPVQGSQMGGGGEERWDNRVSNCGSAVEKPQALGTLCVGRGVLCFPSALESSCTVYTKLLGSKRGPCCLPGSVCHVHALSGLANKGNDRTWSPAGGSVCQ